MLSATEFSVDFESSAMSPPQCEAEYIRKRLTPVLERLRRGRRQSSSVRRRSRNRRSVI
jgi:hypothetical protein